jgi:pyruvate,orthophosphate dikinase
VLYRRQERIPQDLDTAVNVMAMVFGNLGADSSLSRRNLALPT